MDGIIILKTYLKKTGFENSLSDIDEVISVLFFISRNASFSSDEPLGSATREFVPFKKHNQLH
jgi:hypothetical protein